jgi:hypothetical protein
MQRAKLIDLTEPVKPYRRRLGVSRSLELPHRPGPWSWRQFKSRESAHDFFARLGPDHPAPLRLDEDHLSPNGVVLSAGTWVVLYRPIIFD